MTRQERYMSGYVKGELRAEYDRQQPSLMHDEATRLRSEATHAHSMRGHGAQHETYAAYALGLARAYRLGMP